MKTIKRPNPPWKDIEPDRRTILPLKAWTEIEVWYLHTNEKEKEMDIRFIHTQPKSGRQLVLASLPLPTETARELAQAILEEIKP